MEAEQILALKLETQLS